MPATSSTFASPRYRSGPSVPSGPSWMPSIRCGYRLSGPGDWTRGIMGHSPVWTRPRRRRSMERSRWRSGGARTTFLRLPCSLITPSTAPSPR